MEDSDLQMKMNEDEELVIDIPENLELTFRPETCIYRVRPSIRRVNESAYTPQLVSIGPFHHGKPELQNMEIQKLRYLRLFCQRVNDDTTEKQVVNHLARIIRDCEEQIRHCYEEPCEFSSSKFVKMILLDAIFIIEFSLRKIEEEEEHGDDFVFGQESIRFIVHLDLCLIENQLPFFIIKRLYDQTPIAKSEEFATLMCSVFEVSLRVENLHFLEKINHFVDLIRYKILDQIPQKSNDDGTAKLKYSASKLHEAGVRFEVSEYHDDLRPAIEFVDGVLKMPFITVDDFFSELFVRNVITLEQRHSPTESYVCSYFFLMDHLINTAGDVDLLVEAEIIVHWLGSNELFAGFINKLCHGMTDYRTPYGALYEQLNNYYENKWNRRKATLKLVYFNNLWRGTGTVAAGILLLMTLLQTISSVKSL